MYRCQAVGTLIYDKRKNKDGTQLNVIDYNISSYDRKLLS